MDGMMIIIALYAIIIITMRVLKHVFRAEARKERRQNPPTAQNQSAAHERRTQTRTDYNAGTVQEKDRRSAFGGAFSASHKETQKKVQPAPNSSVSPAGNTDAEMSTTAYLQQKADADAVEHAKEHYQEQMRAKRETGGLPAGKRLYDGDPIPNGMRCVKCGYCGAENLVPQMSRQVHTCYFCREELR